LRLFLALLVVAFSAVTLMNGSSTFAAYPGNNGKILYEQTDDVTFDGDIWSMNPDDSGHTNLTQSESYDAEGVWSPDGTKIAFVSDRTDSNFDIWVMDADGGNPTRLTDDAGLDGSPTWSPDGTKIAFASNRDGDGDIWVMNADGSAETNLSNTTVGEGDPTWSPDGTKIAYGHVDQGDLCTSEIYVMDANGMNQTSYTCEITARTPDWSPDGTKIAFGVGIGTGVTVWVMNADGTGEVEISDPSSFNPTWAPDGSKILFDAARPGGIGLYTMNPDGSGEALLSLDAYNAYWQPIPPTPGDTDGDGVADASDNCPTVANADGQSDDADGDSAGDACDAPGSGNVDCSGPSVGVNSVDALKVLRFSSSLPVVQNDPCADIGAAIGGDNMQGDVNCSGGVNSVDALLILRANAGLSVSIPQDCPDIKPE
jgi:Tol biopolymer transport system component